MDSWKILLLLFQPVCLWFVSLVVFVRSFLEHLGIITCYDQGCQNRDPDRKIARFYDPISPKRLKS